MKRLLAVLVALVSSAAACATATQPADGDDAGKAGSDASTSPDATKGNGKDAAAGEDAYVGPTDDGGADAQGTLDAGPPPPKPILYAHSPDTLYTFDPTTFAFTMVAAFSGCTQSTLTQVIDLAIDSNNNTFVTTFDGVYSLNLTTAECTHHQRGELPEQPLVRPRGDARSHRGGARRVLRQQLRPHRHDHRRHHVRRDPLERIRVERRHRVRQGRRHVPDGDRQRLRRLPAAGRPHDGRRHPELRHAPARRRSTASATGRGTLYGFDGAGDVFSIGGGTDAGLVTSDIVVDGGSAWSGAPAIATLAPVTATDGGAISTM